MKYLALLFIPLLAACGTNEFLTMTAEGNQISLECKNLISADSGKDSNRRNYITIVFNEEEGKKINQFSRENIFKEAVLSYKDRVLLKARIYGELNNSFKITSADSGEFIQNRELLDKCVAVR
ncbi:Uncharacterised protein [Leminorella richardii]|uniref:SecDF P1 head subdomain domain-containing protein n=1 Tax=Leminorella richardii TaxID=158841 RepID=A0A2X4XJQ4_9GAMM|nr:hypothetical protein [Leminorella richardii]SQI40095.1 Uncharacterised protein [Leminorella richardii]